MRKTFTGAMYSGWAITCLLFITTSCQKSIETPSSKPSGDMVAADASAAREGSGRLNDLVQVNLVGDNNDFHPARIDSRLVNAWGMAFAPSGPDWVSSNVPGLSVIYNTLGNDVRPPVTIPSHDSATGGHPTGAIFNFSTGFKLSNGNAARFIFVGDDGIISAWNTGNAAQKVLDRSDNSSYTGLAIAVDGADTFIYAANFLKRRIEVFDRNWNQVFTKPFRDFLLPHGYAPFNIQNVGGKLYVMYAKVGADGDEEKGPGKGFVDIYRANGFLAKRFISRGELNAPWGVAMAPDGFVSVQGHGHDGHDGHDDHGDNDRSITVNRDGHGDNHGGHGDGDDNNDLHNVILVGNFGDGFINAYNSEGEFIGHLRSNGHPIQIDGLWAISFAPSTATTIDPNWLFFAAGPDDETHGLFGYIKK